MDALSIQCYTKWKGCCVSRGSLQRLFSCQWPVMPDPSLSLSPLALYSVFSHLPGNRRCMLLCWCLSTAKVSPMCLMDLPVRFSVRFRVPQQSWAAGPCHCLSLGVNESKQGGDEIGLIMTALFLCSMCWSCAPVDQETPGQTETHKGSGNGWPWPILHSLPCCQHAPPSAAVLNYYPHNLSHI